MRSTYGLACPTQIGLNRGVLLSVFTVARLCECIIDPAFQCRGSALRERIGDEKLWIRVTSKPPNPIPA